MANHYTMNACKGRGNKSSGHLHLMEVVRFKFQAFTPEGKRPLSVSIRKAGVKENKSYPLAGFKRGCSARSHYILCYTPNHSGVMTFLCENKFLPQIPS